MGRILCQKGVKAPNRAILPDFSVRISALDFCILLITLIDMDHASGVIDLHWLTVKPHNDRILKIITPKTQTRTLMDSKF